MSFARIHRRNLVAQGILALTFADEADYEKAEVGQTWTLPDVRSELERGDELITARIEDTGDEIKLRHDLAPKEREILVAGGLLSYLRGAHGDGGGPAGSGADHEQHEQRDQGVGGRAE